MFRLIQQKSYLSTKHLRLIPLISPVFFARFNDLRKEVICSLMGKYINSSREEREKIKGKEKAKEVSLPVKITLENDKKLLEKFREECNKDEKLH